MLLHRRWGCFWTKYCDQEHPTNDLLNVEIWGERGGATYVCGQVSQYFVHLLSPPHGTRATPLIHLTSQQTPEEPECPRTLSSRIPNVAFRATIHSNVALRAGIHSNGARWASIPCVFPTQTRPVSEILVFPSYKTMCASDCLCFLSYKSQCP